MEKYLFNDGTNVIREVESREELDALIQSTAESKKIRIWIFSTSEWLTLTEFTNRNRKKETPVVLVKQERSRQNRADDSPIRNVLGSGWWKKPLIAVAGAVLIFLVYNFTRVTWKKAGAMSITAARPANSPDLDADSLIQTVEDLRGHTLDKATRTNLRIRNTWPDLILLSLEGEHDVSREGVKYYNLELSIDNATGYHIDNAEVEIVAWKDGEKGERESFRFSDIGYSSPASKKIETAFRGDSLSVSFTSIKSKAFNFCYSSEKKSNYGNYNDRWFCKD